MMKMKCYHELVKINTYEGRLQYLQTLSKPGYITFGNLRYMNQEFYNSIFWKRARRNVILRDSGNDLGLDDFPINGKIIVHHIFPITIEMLENNDPLLIDEDNLISCSLDTHNKLHYGLSNENKIPLIPERKPNDTCPWR